MKHKRSKRKKLLHGIGARTTISHISVAVVITFFASISIFVLLNTYMRNYVMDRLLEDAVSVSRFETGKNLDEGLDARARYYEDIYNASVIFYDMEYTASQYSLNSGMQLSSKYIIIGSSWDVENLLIMDGVDRYMLASVLKGTPMSDIRSFQFVENEIIFAGAPLYDEDGGIVGGVMLIQPLEIVQEQTEMMLVMLLIIAIISLFVSVVMSLRFSRKLTGPLIEIAEGAQRMAEGDFNTRIVQKTDDEIGGIANSLNSLSARLRHTVGNLRRERDMLDMIMNGINEGIIAVDWYMHTVHCNESFLRMLEMERRPYEVNVECEFGRILKLAMKSNELEKAVWTDPTGNRLMAIASALHSGEGIVIGAVCLVQDISETMRLEQMRRDYVANISHELRTPLTGIRGMVEPLIDGVFETEEEKQSCYEVIYKETIRLEKLIREMLDMSRLQDGRISIDIEPVELTVVMQDAVKRVQATAEEAGIRLIIEPESATEPLMCTGNEDRILQTLTIFLDNALSFTPSGGNVKIYARRIGAYMRIGVVDTGCGIEPKDLPYIWERFYKVDKSRMRTGGTGLGLAIAKLIVELMHGEIGVYSEPNVGTDFWFKLPCYTE